MPWSWDYSSLHISSWNYLFRLCVQYFLRGKDFLQKLKDLTVKIEKAAAEAFDVREWQRSQAYQRSKKEKLVMKMMDLHVRLKGKPKAEDKGEQTQERTEDKKKRKKDIEDFIREYNFTEVITAFTQIFWLSPR